MNSNTIEVIVTEHLILRAMEEKDARALLNTIGDEGTAWWSDDYRFHSIEEAIGFIAWGNEGDEILQYGIFKKDSDNVIGYVQVKLPELTGMPDARELGYALSKEHRRRGYMSEAVNAVCDHLFQDKTIRLITLEVLPNNLPSLGVARKCGFSFVEEPQEKKHLRFLDDQLLGLYVRFRPFIPGTLEAYFVPGWYATALPMSHGKGHR